MKMELLAAVAAMACASLTLSAKDTPYPSEKVAAFVVDKLDVTSLPAVYRPKKQRGKKTLTDYGYTVEKLDQTEAQLGAGGTRRLVIKILQDGSAGIYACMADESRAGANPTAQSVMLLQRKSPSDLLKAHGTWKEFKSCPVIGPSTNDSPAAGEG